MGWFEQLLHGESVAGAVLILSAVATLGLAFGALRIRGIGLGIAGVLFSGLAFGHFGFTINPEVMEFAREFGLILFVYTIGLQVGPSFLASLRREGLPLNLMAAGIVILGGVIAVAIHFAGGVPLPIAVGLLSGATTNTPSLAAAQAALTDIGGPADQPGLGYAIAYPFGIIGIILTMLAVRALFRVDVPKEIREVEDRRKEGIEPLDRLNLHVENPNLAGQTLGQIAMFEEAGVIISRVQHGEVQTIARPDTILHLGDTLLAVGTRNKLNALKILVGRESELDLTATSSSLTSRKLLITKKAVLGKTVRELHLRRDYDVQITRIRRAGVELPVSAALRLNFGDTVVAVGEPDRLDQVAELLGNSVKALNHPEVIPIFVGIVLGVIVGSIPFSVPGMPAPVKLGLAGGPLLVAILLSQIGRIGPLVWHLPDSANFVLREVGIILFLSSVGLKSGGHFMETLLAGNGLVWMGLAAIITVVPLLLVACIARLFMKTNYLTLCGLLAGSMTDPPALAFAGNITGSDAPTVSYATVYPLTMILRVLMAQVIVLGFGV